MGEAKQEIADLCRKLYDRGYVVATSGNVSVRNGNSIFITPTATRKDTVSANHIVECDLRGIPCEKGKNPSSEIEMHRAVYESRADIGAAIHAHPPHCIACSLLGISLTEPVLPEISAYTGPAPTVPYAKPGSPEQAEAVRPYLSDYNAMLLERHGVLVLGKDLGQAFSRLEHLEHVARVLYLVRCGQSS